MLDALKMLQEMKPIHEMDSTSDSTAPTVYGATDPLTLTQPQCIQTTGTSAISPRLASPAKCTPSRKCRLPIPSFMLKVDDVNPIPAKDKIANVQLNRRSLNKTHRNQGSRLPMVILPKSDPLPITTRKENKKTRSAQLSSSISTYHGYNKSDISTKYMSANRIQSSWQQKREQQQTSPSSLSRNTKKKNCQQSLASSPTKLDMSYESVTPATQPLSYTQKRLPESRTDRLMMGIRTGTAARGKSTSTVARETTPMSANDLSSHLTASISGKKRHQEAQQKRSSPICAAISSAITTAPSHQKTSSSSSSSSSCLPERYSPQHNQSHQQQQRQRRKLADGDRKQRPSTTTSPSKVRHRWSSLATTKKPPSSSSPLATSNGTIGKNESFKGIKVLRAY
ncbi:hypothetical protein BCR42DRAFT_399459 [Absidia repens]|uniref:Uncharacterized protein n=1 Tax=Absidia repens TaxID=90262 RepID=A0A1X2J008_9FUNG|nr:hypothetical protein BCR42DRAFT_399459 [Absidia repens]